MLLIFVCYFSLSVGCASLVVAWGLSLVALRWVAATLAVHGLLLLRAQATFPRHVGSYFPDQGLNPHVPHWQLDSQLPITRKSAALIFKDSLKPCLVLCWLTIVPRMLFWENEGSSSKLPASVQAAFWVMEHSKNYWTWREKRRGHLGKWDDDVGARGTQMLANVKEEGQLPRPQSCPFCWNLVEVSEPTKKHQRKH